jgi:hypothetical protein
MKTEGSRRACDNVENPWLEAVEVVGAIRLKARQLADQLDIIIDRGGPRKTPKFLPTS